MDWKHFENGIIKKRWFLGDHVISLTEVSSNPNSQWPVIISITAVDIFNHQSIKSQPQRSISWSPVINLYHFWLIWPTIPLFIDLKHILPGCYGFFAGRILRTILVAISLDTIFASTMVREISLRFSRQILSLPPFREHDNTPPLWIRYLFSFMGLVKHSAKIFTTDGQKDNIEFNREAIISRSLP